MKKQTHSLLFLGFTAVLIGYLTVWLPGPAVGLQFLGIELGEWIKFMGVGLRRNIFYLPPIILGLMMGVATAVWPNNRWQTWVMRGLALAVSLLAFPAVEAILGEPFSQWLLRLLLIGLVFITVLVSSFVSYKWGKRAERWMWLTLALLGLIGAVLPTWVYGSIRPLVSQVIGQSIGIGLGVWLNVGGCLLVLVVGLVRGSKP